MKTQTITLTLRADRDRVFQLLSNLDLWPTWSVYFCRGFFRAGELRKAITPMGEAYLALEADPATGVIDLLVGEFLDEMAIVPLRIISQPHGCAVVLTWLQPAGMPNEVYDRAYRALLSDLRELKRQLGGGELHGDAEAQHTFFPSLVTAKFYESWDFYTSVLGFQTLKECDQYVHLAHSSGVEFGLVVHEMDGLPAELITSTDGRGFWLSITVSDADAEFERLSRMGVEIHEPLEDKPWGERQFSVRDPNGVIIQIAHRTVVGAPVAEDSVLAV
jgi:uncharacterized glyoxalase superfamily protein PhnB